MKEGQGTESGPRPWEKGTTHGPGQPFPLQSSDSSPGVAMLLQGGSRAWPLPVLNRWDCRTNSALGPRPASACHVHGHGHPTVPDLTLTTSPVNSYIPSNQNGGRHTVGAQ